MKHTHIAKSKLLAFALLVTALLCMALGAQAATSVTSTNGADQYVSSVIVNGEHVALWKSTTIAGKQLFIPFPWEIVAQDTYQDAANTSNTVTLAMATDPAGKVTVTSPDDVTVEFQYRPVMTLTAGADANGTAKIVLFHGAGLKPDGNGAWKINYPLAELVYAYLIDKNNRRWHESVNDNLNLNSTPDGTNASDVLVATNMEMDNAWDTRPVKLAVESNKPYQYISFVVEDTPKDGYWVSRVWLTLDGQKYTIKVPYEKNPNAGNKYINTAEINGHTYTVEAVTKTIGSGEEVLLITTPGENGSVQGRGFPVRVYGPGLTKNDVYFEHIPDAYAAFEYEVDDETRGTVTKWIFQGDTNADKVFSLMDWKYHLDILGWYKYDYNTGWSYDWIEADENGYVQDQVHLNMDVTGDIAVNLDPQISMDDVESDYEDCSEILNANTVFDRPIPIRKASWTTFQWGAIDTPEAGYYVYRVEYTNENGTYPLALPIAGETAITEVGREKFTVKLNEDGTVWAYGPSFAQNKVKFYHLPILTLNAETDGDGDITDWVFKGNVLGAEVETTSQVKAVQDRALLAYINDYLLAKNENRTPVWMKDADKTVRNLDMEGSKAVNPLDLTAVNGLYMGHPTGPVYKLSDSVYQDFSVTDTPIYGRLVSKITYTNDSGAHELQLPEAAGTFKVTTVDGYDYTVALDDEGVATVTGPSWVKNDVRFEHEAFVLSTLTLEVDDESRGEITKWIFQGDSDADMVFMSNEWKNVMNYVGHYTPDFPWYKGEQSELNMDLNVPIRSMLDDTYKKRINTNDWTLMMNLALGTEKIPCYIVVADTYVSFLAVDTPKEGWYVSRITYNGAELNIPVRGESTKTKVNGCDYTVELDENGVATVYGPSFAENKVRFEHMPVQTLAFETDGHGQVTDWVMQGNAIGEAKGKIQIDRNVKMYAAKYAAGSDVAAWVDMAHTERNLDVNSDDIVDIDDVNVLGRLYAGRYGALTPPLKIIGEKVLTFAVTDTPDSGYSVSKITYTNDSGEHELLLPLKGQQKNTTVDGHEYTVALDDKGVATVTGPSWLMNKVRFDHTKPADPTPVPTLAPTPEPVDKNDFYFFFTKKWQGEPGEDISFTLYNADGSVHPHEFRKTKVSATEWKYECWLSKGGDYYVLEDKVQGYSTAYANTGLHASDTDRCYNGGTITNTQAPKTGDSSTPALWGMLLAVSLLGMALHVKRRARG